jgi:hypothetical protein
MTSIRLSDLFESPEQRLAVPDGTRDMSTLDAALAWARANFYVLPISPATKHPGSILGKGWPDKTSKDPMQIASWFCGSNAGLAIHVGRSGALAFDVDRPGSLPHVLRQWLIPDIAPFQSTRVGEPHRGHYLFATLAGRTYGNSGGRLGSSWGEVRGRNGIIVVAPTRHAKADQGGRYEWLRTGELPILPADLARRLPSGAHARTSMLDVSEVQTFLDRHKDCAQPETLATQLSTIDAWLTEGKSRHDAVRDGLTRMLTDALAGLYPASSAIDEALALFLSVKPTEEWSSRSEFIDMVRWAVAQVQETPQETLDAIRTGARAAADPAIQAWMRGL